MIRALCLAALVVCAFGGVAIATPAHKVGEWLRDPPALDLRPLGFLIVAVSVVAASFIQ